MTLTTGNIISLLSLLFGGGLIFKLYSMIQTQKRSTDAVKLGIQALLRAQMINDFNHYAEKGYAQSTGERTSKMSGNSMKLWAKME